MNFIKKFYFTWINPKPLNKEELRELLDTSSIDIEKVEHDNWLKNRKKYILYLFFSWIIFFILFFSYHIYFNNYSFYEVFTKVDRDWWELIIEAGGFVTVAIVGYYFYGKWIQGERPI